MNLIREASSYHIWQKQKFTSAQCAESKRLWSTHPKWDAFIKPSPQGSGIYVEGNEERLKEPKVVDNSKEKAFSRYNETDLHMNSQRVWQHMQELDKFRANKISAVEKGSGHKAPLLSRKPFVIDTHWKKEKFIFSNEVSLGVLTTGQCKSHEQK